MQPTAAQPWHLPCPPTQGLGDAQWVRLEQWGWGAGPGEAPRTPALLPQSGHKHGPPKAFQRALLPASTALRQEAVTGAKRALKINVEQKNFHKIKIAVSFPLITYYKPC